MRARHSGHQQARFELRFEPLRDAGRACSFPCDETGRVNMDELAAHMLNSYLFARAVIGHEFARPRVCPLAS